MTPSLDAVYEKFKHLDGCLSDPEWCTSGDGTAIYAIAGELWRAVKEARDRPRPPCEECHINSIIEQKRGCLTCRNPECPVWQAADQNCWKSQENYDAAITTQATAAENKRVLDAVLKCFDAAEFYCYPHQKVDIGTSGCAKFVRCGNILPMIESLRLAQPEPKERDPE